MKKIPVAILGATGAVGQRFVQLLAQHPWFEVKYLTGSERSVGMRYEQACHWILTAPMPEWAREMEILPTNGAELPVQIAFSALPSASALEVESRLAQAGILVCSNASAFRMEEDVPILLPEVNADHIQLLDFQRKNRGWKGGIITNPNCTSTGMTVVLKALQDRFGLRNVFAVSLQALSGAGYPGVASLDILDNILPNIYDEEEKVETEPCKMLGKFTGERIEFAPFKISAHTNRVPVSEGHTVCISVEFEKRADVEEVKKALVEYKPPTVCYELPSTPGTILQVMEENDRPQPRLDRMAGDGMTTSVGRIRQDALLDVKMVVLSHNTIRGAAGGSIYNAELAVKMGFV